eukprot:INCI5136.6.p1 GENE.INCI5136.6~~INCI5136.6.p1  ORF type:complete len:765 (-),score=108.10 INCI5136.6:2540-4834(-)
MHLQTQASHFFVHVTLDAICLCLCQRASLASACLPFFLSFCSPLAVVALLWSLFSKGMAEINHTSSSSSPSPAAQAAGIGFASAVACGVAAFQYLQKRRPAFVASHLGGVDEGDEDSKPVTERRNALSANMHSADAIEMFEIGHRVDRQIIDSFKDFPRLDSPEKLKLVQDSVSLVAEVLEKSVAKNVTGSTQAPPVAAHRVVLSGSGTSGRIGFYVARKYNALLRQLGKPEVFGYTISGGDSALLLSDELPEDDPQAGVADLHALCGGPQHPCLIIGITCGLSAPYCAGQVDHVLDRIDVEENDERTNTSTEFSGSAAILMGFNPPELARNVPIEHWAGRNAGSKTVRDVVKRVHTRMTDDLSNSQRSAPRAVLLNPIIGPEFVCASSRMKGGSVTLVLLEVIFTRAICEVFGPDVAKHFGEAGAGTCNASVADLVQTYSQCIDEAYSPYNRAEIAPLLKLAGDSLSAGGHLYWLGSEGNPRSNVVAAATSGPVAGNGGVLALIDQSEMPDTYGCPFSDIRGFVPQSWRGLGNVAGDLSAQSGLHRIGISHFKEDVLPSISGNDVVVVVLGVGEDTTVEVEAVCRDAASRGAHLAVVAMSCASDQLTSTPRWQTNLPRPAVAAALQLARVDLLPNTGSLADLSMKMLLNVVSSGMQVPCGRIFRNLMINFSPSNDKIYNRCIHQIAFCARCSRANAELALIRAIRKTDRVTIRAALAPKSDHIRLATPQTEAEKNIPQIVQAAAILLASGRCKTYAQVRPCSD